MHDWKLRVIKASLAFSGLIFYNVLTHAHSFRLTFATLSHWHCFPSNKSYKLELELEKKDQLHAQG